MPRKPEPKLQVGSPRAQRTPIDDKTFEELSSRTESPQQPSVVPDPAPTSEAPPRSRSMGRRGRASRSNSKPATAEPANRKGRSGEPYVRKTDGVPTVPQYLTLPTDLVKRLKIHAVENDMKVSDIAAEAIAAYLDKR